MSEIRRYDVGMSVEALASAWARTEDAPAGSTVVVHNEISGRLRGGTPWRLGGDDALAMAVVVRPAVSPLREALLWLVVSLAAADALVEAAGSDHSVVWPDQVIGPGEVGLPCDKPTGATNVVVQLGPGRIDHAVLAMRVDLSGLAVTKDHLIAGFQERVEAGVRSLETDRLTLVDAFTERCSIIGQRVLVQLMPRGEARGTATAVDPDGFLVLESPTGMLERIAPASMRSLSVT